MMQCVAQPLLICSAFIQLAVCGNSQNKGLGGTRSMLASKKQIITRNVADAQAAKRDEGCEYMALVYGLNVMIARGK